MHSPTYPPLCRLRVFAGISKSRERARPHSALSQHICRSLLLQACTHTPTHTHSINSQTFLCTHSTFRSAFVSFTYAHMHMNKCPHEAQGRNGNANANTNALRVFALIKNNQVGECARAVSVCVSL